MGGSANSPRVNPTSREGDDTRMQNYVLRLVWLEFPKNLAKTGFKLTR